MLNCLLPFYNLQRYTYISSFWSYGFTTVTVMNQKDKNLWKSIFVTFLTTLTGIFDFSNLIFQPLILQAKSPVQTWKKIQLDISNWRIGKSKCIQLSALLYCCTALVQTGFGQINIRSIHGRPVVPGCAGCARAHPDFGRSVNPISTRGDRLCPPNYYGHTQIFRPSDVPAWLWPYQQERNQMYQRYRVVKVLLF